MTLMKRNSSFPAWPSLFDDFFNTNWMDWSTRNFSETNSTLPSVNVKETDNEFVVEMAAPGMKKDDFKIVLDNNVLQISSEVKEEKNDSDKEGRYTQREFSYQSFTRTFTLPEIVEDDKIDACYKDGILKINIPKKEEARPKPKKEIQIK